MNKSDAQELLQSVVRDVLGDNTIVLDRSATAANYDGWDSLAHANVLAGVEEILGVDLPARKAFEAADIGELVDIIQAAADGKAAP